MKAGAVVTNTSAKQGQALPTVSIRRTGSALTWHLGPTWPNARIGYLTLPNSLAIPPRNGFASRWGTVSSLGHGLLTVPPSLGHGLLTVPPSLGHGLLTVPQRMRRP
jgi:hypothetical protein